MASLRLRQLCAVIKPARQQHQTTLTLSPSACNDSDPSHDSADVIKVTPKVSLFDQRVHILVQGLPRNVKVTLHAAVDATWRRKPVNFVSCAYYVTDDQGEVDVSKDECLGGTYSGVEPMGLFWSMEASPAGPRNIRMVVRDVQQPLIYHLSVHMGHLSLSDLHVTQPLPRPFAMTTLQRLVKAEGVKRLPVKDGSVRGTLFLPPGEGPFPGVIDMFGFAGGLMESRASLLASHGFAALSLAIFNYQDLPSTIEGVNFAYFEESVRWLTSHPSVKEEGIGVVAVSGGASFALAMGWKLPQVVAVVSINSPIFCTFHDLYYGDKFLLQGVQTTSHDPELVQRTDEGVRVTDSWLYTEDDIIPIWESPTQVLALISDDDGQVSPTQGDQLRAIYPEDRRHLIEVVHYPGAGHLLEPPFTPHCRFCFNPPYGADLLWGGRKEEHAKAQEDAWERAITFLNTHLS